MNSVKIIDEIKIRFPEQVVCKPSIESSGYNFPEIIKPIYTLTDGISFPFGRIFSLKEAISQSKRKPFKPNWFVFGFDNYFTFWLCKYSSNNNLWFTTWDHESGNEIGDAVWSNLTEFLFELIEDFEEQ